ncbi:DUF934 domain-containing protein [Oryzibacter oryziterrae]|uniref:DUF934 domain-containing protein n=1 Tax=Oryzibacter oryziterrae TaxID=2766474 RepID=UPI001F33250E|nr:DUF934 domain-containing protein [Oryzibacter oryziterrae]
MSVQSALIPAAPPTVVSTADVFRNGAFEANDFAQVEAGAGLPESGGVLVPLADLQATLDGGHLGNRRIGVVLRPADDVNAVLPFLDRLAVIAIDFPKYTDGRGFSHATRIARTGFSGELRAIGNVLIDQITYMKRLGFTAFEVRHAITREYLAAGRDPAPQIHYQPAVRVEAPVGTRPWLRRAR